MVVVSYEYGLRVGRAKIIPFATSSAEVNKSGGFAKVELGPHLIQVKDSAGLGAAYGKIQEVSNSKIILENSLGDKTEEFILDQETTFLMLKAGSKTLDKEGSLADLKPGQIIQVSFLTSNGGFYLATAVIQMK